MIEMTPQALLKHMKKNQYEAEIQPDTQQVYTVLKISERDYPLFLRVYDNGQLLQILVFLPSKLEKEKVTEIARMLHLLNKELDIPGFGMDEMAGVIFYRVMLPTPHQKIEGDLLNAFLQSIDHVCQMFAIPIEAVAQGHANLDEILKQIQENEGSQELAGN